MNDDNHTYPDNETTLSAKKQETIEREYKVDDQSFKLICRTMNGSITQLFCEYNQQTISMPITPTFLYKLTQATAEISRMLKEDLENTDLPPLEAVAKKLMEKPRLKRENSG